MLPLALRVLNIMIDMAMGPKASRVLAYTLIAALYVLTLAGCVVNLPGQEPAEREVSVPESVRQPALLEAKTTKAGRGQHKKAATEASSTASKTDIPLPDSNLLVPPPEPNCELGAPDLKAADPRKLDYERQCYRAAEVFARSRLLLLQNSVDEMIKAIPDTRLVSP